MFRLLATIFLVAAGTFIYSYFRELNPGSVVINAGPDTSFELNTVSLILLAMAVGAVAVAILVSAHQTSHVILNWRTNRLLRRKEKVDVLHRDGVAILLVEQNVPLTLEVSQRVYIMEKGAVRHHAAASELGVDDEVIHQYLGV